jgi:hypothetical protein
MPTLNLNMKKLTLFALALCLLPFMVQAEYYRPFRGGYARYKLEAIRQLVTPQMKVTAEVMSADKEVQDEIEIALALEPFVYNGLRLVRMRGMLYTTGDLTEETVGRTMMYYGVTHDEALAWLLASRSMQLTGFKTGDSLPVLESDIVATAEDLQWHLETYFSKEVIAELMPHFVWAREANLPLIHPLAAELPQVPTTVSVPAPEPVKAKKHGFWGFFCSH